MEVHFFWFFLNFLKYTETKLFHLHRILKNGGGEGIRANPLNNLWIHHWYHALHTLKKIFCRLFFFYLLSKIFFLYSVCQAFGSRSCMIYQAVPSLIWADSVNTETLKREPAGDDWDNWEILDLIRKSKFGFRRIPHALQNVYKDSLLLLMFKFTIESQMLSQSLSLWLSLSLSLSLFVSLFLSLSLSLSLHPTYYLGQLSVCQQNTTWYYFCWRADIDPLSFPNWIYLSLSLSLSQSN